MNYLKQNHLSILIIAFLIISSLGIGSQTFGALDRTTVGNPWTFSGAVTFSSTVTNSGAVTNSSTVANNGVVTNNAGVIRSYTNSTTTTDTATPLIQADLLNYDTILAGLDGGAATWTLPATSTLTSMIPSAGDRQETCVLAGNANLTWAAGTGIDLETASSSATDLTILAGNFGCLTFVRATTTDVHVLLREFTNGD